MSRWRDSATGSARRPGERRIATSRRSSTRCASSRTRASSATSRWPPRTPARVRPALARASLAGPALRRCDRCASQGLHRLVVTSLALGIGANTAIYSFMEAIAASPAAGSGSGSQLVVMKWEAQELRAGHERHVVVDRRFVPSTRRPASSAASFRIRRWRCFRTAATTVERRSATSPSNASRSTAQGQTDPVKGQYVSGGYFEGMAIVAGRRATDSAAGRRSGGAERGRVLSDAFSRRHFGDAGAAVGQTRATQRQAVHRDWRRAAVVLRRRARRRFPTSTFPMQADS